MSKLKLGVVFGGISVEHDVSIESGTSIITHLDCERYEVFSIYIDQKGNWYECEKIEKQIKIGESISRKTEIQDVMEYLKKFDVIFPVLHGLYGEDGTIQGLFELLKIPYVGCGVLASCIGMDKVYTKMIFDKAGIEQAKYIYIRKEKEGYCYFNEFFEKITMTLEEISQKAQEKLPFPMFVKPSNSGSSLGINQAKNEVELKQYIEEAANYDTKIIIEEGIIGQELECGVLGNERIITSCVGEIKPAEEFYTFDAKYKLAESRTLIPAEITKEKSEKIQEIAKKAFQAIDGKGLSRVDFFLETKTGRIILNEINTLPGFTNISMYPKMFEFIGVSYRDLLNQLIQLALENK